MCVRFMRENRARLCSVYAELGLKCVFGLCVENSSESQAPVDKYRCSNRLGRLRSDLQW